MLGLRDIRVGKDTRYGEYGIKVAFPCVKLDTPWGPLQVGKCGEEAKKAAEALEKYPGPSPLEDLLPIMLIGGVGLAVVMILMKRKKQRGK